MKTARSAALVLLVCGAATLLSAGCSRRESNPRYEAEKALFNARKQAGGLTFPVLGGEFLERALAAYRTIIEKHGGEAGRVEGLEMIVVSSQMELAELEFRAEMYEEARADFLAAYEMATNIPAARANALWSAAYISWLLGDRGGASDLFSRFSAEFLGPDRAAATAAMNRRYLLTPVRLAEIALEAEDEREASRRLGEAERLYRRLIDDAGAAAPAASDSAPAASDPASAASDPARLEAPDDLLKELRYNLVTVHLLGGRWSEARAAVAEMKELYRGEADIPGLLILEARIENDGLGNRRRALEILDSLTEAYPDSRQAPTALLSAGNLHLAAGDFDRAAEAYRKIIGDYAQHPYPEIVEATWQLARVEEARGKWLDASLLFKSVYTDFPATIQGMEAPLHIALYYRETGETEAARAAFDRAIAHYERLASRQYSESIRIVAEEYYLRALAEQKRWEEAAERLLALPERYPGYAKYRGNCLMAASIYEHELGDAARALVILRQCVSRNHGTDLAEEAQRQIERIEAGQ